MAPVRALTNLAHLNWLRVPVKPPPSSGHTSYRLEYEPAVEVVWTYAERTADGGFRRVGGGWHDRTTDRYGQGAFNADDIARAAVVYLRHWRATGDPASQEAAYGLLRALAYLQTGCGPNVGNVVLWMQPDGRLNHSADPPEAPDPSDSAESFWLARTVWAFGEGYAAFAGVDPGFAAFLGERLQLALTAVERQSLARYPRTMLVDGVEVPAWLIGHGADATGEALLGLAAYVRATDEPRARGVLDRLAEGVAAMSAPALARPARGTASAGVPGSGRWPVGALMPSALEPTGWHAWGGLAAAGLAAAYGINGYPVARDAVLADTAVFSPYLLISTGPDNAGPEDAHGRVQIAYGAQSRVESLLSVAANTDRPDLAVLAAVSATWFFGNNPAGAPVYDPKTGCTFDGIDPPGGRRAVDGVAPAVGTRLRAVAPPGTVNPDSGAESTIHGLLAMLALDADPALAELASTACVLDRRAGTPDGTALAWLSLWRPGTSHRTVLTRNPGTVPRRAAFTPPGESAVRVLAYDGTGRVVARQAVEVGAIGPAAPLDVVVPGGGFAVMIS